MVELTFTALTPDESAERLLVVGPSLGTGTAQLWERCVPLLPEGWQVVGWDLPGHGAGRPTADVFTVADLAAAVRERTVALAAGRPSAYAGVSLGGAVGFTLALDPGPFGRIATLASRPSFPPPEAWLERAALVRSSGTSALVAGSAQRWFAPGFLEREPGVGNALLLALQEVDDESYARCCEALAAYDVTARLAEVAVPLLVVGGKHDVVVPPDVVEAAAAAAPGARSVVLDGAAHLPPAEDPAAVAVALTDFLNEPAVEESR